MQTDLNPLMHHFLGITQHPPALGGGPAQRLGGFGLGTSTGFGGPVFSANPTPPPQGRPMPPLGPQRSLIR